MPLLVASCYYQWHPNGQVFFFHVPKVILLPRQQATGINPGDLERPSELPQLEKRNQEAE